MYIAWEQLNSDMTIGFIQYSSELLFPLAAVILGYRAIVAEQVSGSLKFILSLPLTRGEILLGKFVGRTIGIAIPCFLAFGIITVIGILQYGLFSPLRYLGVLVITLLYLAVLVSVVTSISTLVNRTATAAATLFIGLILIFEIAWEELVTVFYYLMTGIQVNRLDPPPEGGLFLLERLSPSGAYNTITNWILDAGNSASIHSQVLTEIQPGSTTNILAVETAFSPESVPLYLHESVGILILGLWGLVPLTIAYYSFNKGDLE